jgi:AraC-like DNA-binding protein
MDKNFFHYLSVPADLEKWGLYVTSLGYSNVGAYEEYPQGRHPASHELTWNRGRTLNDYYLIFISKGEGVFNCGDRPTQVVEAGTCFFLYPHVWHRYKPSPKVGWVEYWIGFNGPFAVHIMRHNFDQTGAPVMQVGFESEIVKLFMKMLDMVSASFLGYPQQLSGLLLQLLGCLYTKSKFDIGKEDPQVQLIGKAKFLIQQSIEDALDMEELARQLPMGYSTFRKQFKKMVGESPNQYHQKLRIERAKELLITTILNINEIADKTGFESVYHFSKLFKAKTGVAPTIFRERNSLYMKRDSGSGENDLVSF